MNTRIFGVAYYEGQNSRIVALGVEILSRFPHILRAYLILKVLPMLGFDLLDRTGPFSTSGMHFGEQSHCFCGVFGPLLGAALCLVLRNLFTFLCCTFEYRGKPVIAVGA